MKVLFVTEKYADGNSSLPITNHQHNLFGSLEASGLAEFKNIYYDEFYHEFKKNINEFMVKTVNEYQPDYTIVSTIPWYKYNPTAFDKIADKTKLIFIFPDGAKFLNNAKEYEKYGNVILWDVDCSWTPNSKITHLWTPQDPRIFYNPDIVRDIDVSFVGNAFHKERVDYLKKVNVYCVGGKNYLNVKDYADVIQRSKISLNFSLNVHNVPQLKGRVFESTLCGSMLMESHNEVNWIERWFIPDIHYVYFNSPEELNNKITYYLNNEKERMRISNNGWLRSTEWYNNVSWWKRVLEI